jgi:hypothetical protein
VILDSDKLKSGRLNEKLAVETWNHENHLIISPETDKKHTKNFAEMAAYRTSYFHTVLQPAVRQI